MNGLRKKLRCYSIVTQEKYNFYEILCNFCQGLGIKPWGNLEKKYKDAIIFSHLKVTPKGAFSLVILATAFMIVIPMIFIIMLGIFNIALIILLGILAGIIFYYLYSYPMHYATVFRINASSEMTLCVLYMVTSMRISPNLERALYFAASNLRGPLALDLKKLMWEIYVGKYTTENALDIFMEKWKRDNEEFTNALYLIRNSPYATNKKIEDILDEAIYEILNGTKDRMRGYARKLKTPITVINTLGILLPLIGVVFFPLMGMFMPEMIQPITLAVGYTIILPVTTYFLMKKYLEERPCTFHQPDISRHPKFRKEKLISKELFGTLAICILLSFTGLLILLPIKTPFSFEQLLVSLLVTGGIGAAIIFFCFSSMSEKIKLREEIIRIESEFSEALYQLGSRLNTGAPLENVIKEVTPKIKNLKISHFFNIIIYNMETFGMTLEQSIFDPVSGAINQYPSTLIEAMMKTIADIQKKGGFSIISKIMISISTYLKNISSVEEDLQDMMSEVTSSLDIQAMLLAPLTAGIVVALAAIIMNMLISFGGITDPLYESLKGYGGAGAVGGGFLTSFININKMIPVHFFQIIVGIYMIEIVVLMTMFLSIIENGEENILKRLLIGKRLLMGIVIYFLVMILVYSAFSAMMPPIGQMV